MKEEGMQQNNNRPIVIMAGGTGGHVFPGLAVANDLRAQGISVVWLGTRSGLEANVIPAAGIPIEYIDIGGLRGKGVLVLLKAPWRLARALWQARAILRRVRPRAVIGMGGFVTGPGGVMAWLQRIPLVIHEQNAVAGLTNKLLARFASRVLEAFPDTFTAGKKVIATGNPVRGEILQLESVEKRYQEHTGNLRLFVFGGSLGAQVLNHIVPAALARLDARHRPQVWHQTGKNNLEQTKRLYKEAGVQARIEPFIEDMASAYAWADLVACRAGALTVSELAAAGVASLLIPYPHAVDDHQTANAHYLADTGAAFLVSEPHFTTDYLVELLNDIQDSEGRGGLMKMAQTARSLAKTDATQQVVELCLEVSVG